MKEGRRDSWSEIRAMERWKVRCMRERGVVLHMKALLLSSPIPVFLLVIPLSYPPLPSSSPVIAGHCAQELQSQKHAKIPVCTCLCVLACEVLSPEVFCCLLHATSGSH